MRTAQVKDTRGNLLTVTLPSVGDIMNLRVGHQAPTCFHALGSKVTEIFARDVDVHGKAFVCYYAEFGEQSQISYSLKQDTLDRTFSLCSRYTSSELDALEAQARIAVLA